MKDIVNNLIKILDRNFSYSPDLLSRQIVCNLFNGYLCTLGLHDHVVICDNTNNNNVVNDFIKVDVKLKLVIGNVPSTITITINTDGYNIKTVEHTDIWHDYKVV